METEKMVKSHYIFIALFIIMPLLNVNTVISEETIAEKIIVWRFDDISINTIGLLNRFVLMTENVTKYGGYVGWGFITGSNESQTYWSPQNLTYKQENIDKFNTLTQDEHVFLWLHCWNHSWWAAEQYGLSVWTKSIEEQRDALNHTIWTFYNNFGYYPHIFSAGGSQGNVNTTRVLAERDMLLLSGNSSYEPPDERLRYLTLPSDKNSIVFDLYAPDNGNYLNEMKATFTAKYSSYPILQVMVHPFDWNESTIPLFAEFIEWIYTNHDLINMNFTDAYNYKVLISRPSKVTGLTVKNAKDGKLDLSWNTSPEYDIDHYNIYRDGGFLITVTHPGTYYQDPGLTNGQSYSYTVSAVDTSGNEGNQSDSVSGAPTQNQMPIADLSAGESYQGFINTEITFDGSKSNDSDGSITNWTWFFGDNTNGSGKTIRHVYSKVGTYTVSLIVTDDNGATNTDTTTCVIKSSGGGGGGGGSSGDTENKKPVANASAGEPYQGLINSQITFDGSKSYDSDGTITNWFWIFGDNMTGTGKTIQHSYSNLGTYTLTLTVTDNKGATHTDTTTCIISKPINRAPSIPIITGPTNGTRNTMYTYTTVSTDADNDTIKYTFNWGDPITPPQSDGFLPNGSSCIMHHSWTNAGRYDVTVTATDNTTTSSSKITVYIDAEQTGDIGYLLDNNGDSIYDAFYSDALEQITTAKEKDGNYTIDSNGDGDWDYTFDETNGLTLYQKPSKTPGFELIFVIGAVTVAMFFLIKKRNI